MSEEKESEETFQVRVVFEGDMARKFAAIKKRYGIESNADLIRLLVTLEYEKITGKRE